MFSGCEENAIFFVVKFVTQISGVYAMMMYIYVDKKNILKKYFVDEKKFMC